MADHTPSPQTMRQYTATVTETTSGDLSVEQFVGSNRSTPGNVGICLSGGGSRALSAGMGQLRALEYLSTDDGASLLSQAKAISTVSGGSWLGVSFEYLTSGTSDPDFLNTYVADPGDLVLTKTEGSSIGEILDQLPVGNIGTPIANESFSLMHLAGQAFILWFTGTPANTLWQVLMGMHILSEYDLYSPGVDMLPTSLFSWDRETLKQDVVGPNGGPEGHLGSETAHLVASGSGRTPRPYHVCNTAMFVKSSDGTELLAPVQATPFFTGIVSSPDATDSSGQKVGGGGVTSFAFNSTLKSKSGSSVEVEQTRQWSLTDIAGASSAAFAGELEKLIQDKDKLFEHLGEFGLESWELIKKTLPSAALVDLDEAKVSSFLEDLALDDVSTALSDFHLGDIIPAYDYWPALGTKPASGINKFADGGNLENTGVASLLAYRDIDSVIAFINSATALDTCLMGAKTAEGHEVPHTKIKVDEQLPPLFGYQPHDVFKGYVPYSCDPHPSDPYKSKSQIFPTSDFPKLLQGLWKNSGSGENIRPANFRQSLQTVKNDWFGVAERNVTVLWVYTNAVDDWTKLLQEDVRQKLALDFPHYDTLRTNLSETEINLLASLCAWCVADEGNNQPFLDLFTNPG